MKIFGAVDYPQGSPGWWELRRGLLTASNCDRILTPKQCKFSAQADDLIDELIGDLVNQSPNWFSEKGGKPPNQAVQEGVDREAESRKWFAMHQDVEVQEVGFCLADCGRSGFSPDGLVHDDGMVCGLELKNPMHKTQLKYLRDPERLPDDYRCQVHAQLLFGGLACVYFLSYAPPLPPVLVRVTRDKFTEALAEAVEQFHGKYAEARRRLGLPPGLFKPPQPMSAVAMEEGMPF